MPNPGPESDERLWHPMLELTLQEQQHRAGALVEMLKIAGAFGSENCITNWQVAMALSGPKPRDDDEALERWEAKRLRTEKSLPSLVNVARNQYGYLIGSIRKRIGDKSTHGYFLCLDPDGRVLWEDLKLTTSEGLEKHIRGTQGTIARLLSSAEKHQEWFEKKNGRC